MLRFARILLLGVIFITCRQEELIPTGSVARAPKDYGIYEIDSSKSDAFCQFKLIDRINNCWSDQVTVYEDCHYNLLFTRYGNGWTGSDATYSIQLPGGRIMWMFGDTFLGSVTAQRTRGEAPFIRNSVMIQDGHDMQTLHAGTSGAPRAFVSPNDSKNWYWPLDATMYRDKIQWMLGELGSNGSGGAWDFAYRGFDLAILNPVTMEVESIERRIQAPDISYGSCVLEDEHFIYIYGIMTKGLSKTAHIARAPEGNMQNEWSFFDGQQWVDEPSKFVIAKNVSDQFSVIKENNTYYLITHEPYFSRRIQIMQSDSPAGPWANRRTIYCTPENTDQIFTYNSFVHPELSENGELRISYNINSFNFNDLFNNADLYRPKFVRIDNWQ